MNGDSGLCHGCLSLDDAFGSVCAEDDADVDADVDTEDDADADTVEDADAAVPCSLLCCLFRSFQRRGFPKKIHSTAWTNKLKRNDFGILVFTTVYPIASSALVATGESTWPKPKRSRAHLQRNAVGNSPAMEFEGFKRCFNNTESAGLKISTFVSDRHITIRKAMRIDHKDIKHYFDSLHLKKSEQQYLSKLEKRPTRLQDWRNTGCPAKIFVLIITVFQEYDISDKAKTESRRHNDSILRMLRLDELKESTLSHKVRKEILGYLHAVADAPANDKENANPFQLAVDNLYLPMFKT
eukprot:gene5807-11107_t